MKASYEVPRHACCLNDNHLASRYRRASGHPLRAAAPRGRLGSALFSPATADAVPALSRRSYGECRDVQRPPLIFWAPIDWVARIFDPLRSFGLKRRLTPSPLVNPLLTIRGAKRLDRHLRCLVLQGVRAVSESMISGYVPGSVVWVPWSIARPEAKLRRKRRESWLQRLFSRRRPSRPSLYQRCLAIHIMTTSEAERAVDPS
jgi:hypothetical protein